jgi:GAF domain-containing protein
VALIFYGDDLPDGGPLPRVEELELLMIQAGLAIEKAALEQRLQALENRQRGAGAAAG